MHYGPFLIKKGKHILAILGPLKAKILNIFDSKWPTMQKSVSTQFNLS